LSVERRIIAETTSFIIFRRGFREFCALSQGHPPPHIDYEHCQSRNCVFRANRIGDPLHAQIDALVSETAQIPRASDRLVAEELGFRLMVLSGMGVSPLGNNSIGRISKLLFRAFIPDQPPITGTNLLENRDFLLSELASQ
jgi:hypothetical protein